MELLDSIKTLLELKDESSDAILSIMIEDSKRAILDYCNISLFPKQLEYVVRDLVINSFKSNELEGVASISRGNTSISYNSITVDSFTDKQKSILHRYKKIIIK